MVVALLPGTMKYPLSTGQAARALGLSEPRLNALLRRRRIAPEPPIVAGRRLWGPAHVLQAARHLGALDDELRAELEELIDREGDSAA